MTNEKGLATALKVDVAKDSSDQEYTIRSFEVAVAMGGLLTRAGYSEKMTDFSQLASEAFLENRDITLAEALGKLSLIDAGGSLSVIPAAEPSIENQMPGSIAGTTASEQIGVESDGDKASDISDKEADYYIRAHNLLSNYYGKEAVENLTNIEIEQIINAIPKAIRTDKTIDGRFSRFLDLKCKRLSMWLDGIRDTDIAKLESVSGSTQIAKGRNSLLTFLSENVTFDQLSVIAKKDAQVVKKTKV